MDFRAHPDTKAAVTEYNFLDVLTWNLHSKFRDVVDASLGLL